MGDFYIEWWIYKKVLLIHCEGDVSVDFVNQLGRTIEQYYRKGTEPIHVLMVVDGDQWQADFPMDRHDIHDALRVFEKPKWGTVLIKGRTRFATQLLIVIKNHMGKNVRGIMSLKQGIEYLHEIDATLPATNRPKNNQAEPQQSPKEAEEDSQQIALNARSTQQNKVINNGLIDPPSSPANKVDPQDRQSDDDNQV